MAISDRLRNKIIKLWKTPSFSGSASGLSTFQDALKEKGIKISYNQLYVIMRDVPDYITTTRPIRRYPRRKMIVHGYGNLWQADLAEMPHDGDFRYFLLCIDIFSRKIFCRPLKSKTSLEVRNAFEEIFEEAHSVCNKLETDQGTEFKGNKKYFKEKKFFFRFKTGLNKASFAEHAIYLVKRRLYRILRSLLKDNWAFYLSQVVKNLNNTPNSAIGNLKPSEINSHLDDEKIDKIKGVPQYPTLNELIGNETSYSKNKKNIQLGDYVYADFPSKLFDKSFDTQRGQLYIVDRVLAGEKPEIYYLKDLLGAKVPGTFYGPQLHKTSPPKKGEFFKIEKILKTKKVKGKVLYLVKYLFYPDKFNSWILKTKISYYKVL